MSGLVRVKVLGHLRTALGQTELDMDGSLSTVGALIQTLSQKLTRSDLSITSENTLIMVNGVEISALSEYDTPLSDKDTVVLIPVVHGGNEDSNLTS